MPSPENLRSLSADHGRCSGPHIAAGFGKVHLENRVTYPIPNEGLTGIGNGHGLRDRLSEKNTIADCS